VLVLFDHGTPKGLALVLSEHTVHTAQSRGWDRLDNGALEVFGGGGTMAVNSPGWAGIIQKLVYSDSSMAKKSTVRVTPSTGNVFRDLGFSTEESEHLLVRADLLIPGAEGDYVETRRAVRGRESASGHAASSE